MIDNENFPNISLMYLTILILKFNCFLELFNELNYNYWLKLKISVLYMLFYFHLIIIKIKNLQNT